MLSSVLTQKLTEAGIPGGVVDLVDDKGTHHSAQVGDSDGADAMAENFALRSITKSMVGTVILQLAQEGALSLEDPVSKFLDGVPNGDKITIQQLGTMRSGLVDYTKTAALAEALPASLEVAPDTDTLLDMALKEPPNFQPDESYEYSNTNTLLLGKIIEKIEGKPWDQVINERINVPLKTASLIYPGDDPLPQPASAGYQVFEGTAEEMLPVSLGWLGAAVGLVGNVVDLGRWARALGTGELLDSATQTDRIGSLGPITDDPLSPHYDQYGFAIGQIDGWYGHTGTGLGYQALAMYDPKTDTTIAIMINGESEDLDLPAAIFRSILEEMPA